MAKIEISVAEVKAHDSVLFDASFAISDGLRPELRPWLVESLLVQMLAKHGSADPQAFMATMTKGVIKRHAAGENGNLTGVLLKRLVADDAAVREQS